MKPFITIFVGFKILDDVYEYHYIRKRIGEIYIGYNQHICNKLVADVQALDVYYISLTLFNQRKKSSTGAPTGLVYGMA